jgi:NAD-dependent deacetylase
MTATEQLASMISESSCVVALTGAGISVPSGIPDFRSEGGLWTKVNPEEVASTYGFASNPTRFWDFYIRTWHTLHRDYEPNPAHEALTRMQQTGNLRAIITQNIDGLHQKAGSREVLEVHGTTRTWSCTACGAVYDADKACEQLPTAGSGHRSCLADGCSQPVKPDVVLFGEGLPEAPWKAASEWVQDCDLLICIGTSLTVRPVADFAKRVNRRKGQRLVVVANGWTAHDRRSLLKVTGSADVVLSETLEHLT